MEGRRVVPLMPRLVHPTPFTSLATTVSKIVTQNPRICLNQTSNCLHGEFCSVFSPQKWLSIPQLAYYIKRDGLFIQTFLL